MVFTGLWDGPNTSAKCTNQIEIPIKCFDNRIIQGEIIETKAPIGFKAEEEETIDEIV